MPLPKLLHSSLPAFALTLAVLGGCDGQEPEIDAAPFEDGVSEDTEGGAFRVVLSSRQGLSVGENNLVTRVGFHDPNDPLDPGRGIPGADVRLDAFTADGESHVSDLQGSYLGDGRYEFSDLVLDRPGVWRFEFSIAVGETIDESVAFAFEISD
jgi:hypothetical protein